MAAYLNGTLNGTVAGSTVSSNFSCNLFVNGRNGTSTNSVNGNFGELIVYNSGLTQAQRQQVEGYLVKKWAIDTVTPTFTDPTSISNCTLWLDAQDASTITGTSPVTQWNDKSGKGSNTLAYSGTPARVTSAINGYPAMRFNGSSYFWGSNTNTTSNATFFLIATVEPNSLGSAYQQYTCAYAFSSITAGEIDYAYASSMSGPVLPNAGPSFVLQPFQRPITGSFTNFAPGYSNVFLLTNVFSNGTVYSYQNGNLIGSVASTGVFNIGRYAIGCQTYAGSTGFNYQWTGYIGEVIAYSNALTSDQRQQVEYYLSAKWRLDSSFNPNMIPGCRTWLDAADSSMVVTSGSTVTQWNDKSSNAYSFTGSNVVTSSFGLTSNPSLYFNGTSSYLSSTVSITNPYSFFIVCYGASAANNARILSAASDGVLLVGFVSGNAAVLTGNGTWGATDPYPTTIYKSWALIDASVSGATTQGYLSGVAQTVRVANTASTLTTLIIGNSSASISGASPWLGYCSEVIFYSGVLTTLQRQQVEYYLSTKWGLNTSASLSPLTMGNCAVWFDAADTSTITTTGGTTLATWSNKGDVGGSAAPATGTITTNVATYNGSNIVRFAQTSSLSITMYIPYQPRSWFAVFRQTYQLNSTNPYFTIFGNYTTSGADQVVGPEYNSGGYWTMTEYRGGVVDMINMTKAINGYNTFNVYNWTNSAASTASNRIAINGTAATLTTSSLASGYSTASLVYKIMNGYTPSADLAELICINREITTLEQQRIEYYLAQKWGLSSSSNFAPTQISNCALWLDASDGTTFTYSSGSNVSQWNDKSGKANNAVRGSWGTYPTRTTSNTVLFSNTSSSTQYLNTQAGRQTTQAVTWIAVVKVFSVTNGGNVLDQRKDITNGQPFNAIGMTSMTSRPAGTNTTVDITYTLPLTTPMVIVYQTTANTEYAYVNGVLVGSNLSALSLPAADTGYTTIGAVTDIPAIISSASQTLYSQAVLEISELIMYNAYISSSQRRDVEKYLTDKWGLSSSSNFSPLQIPTCCLWLDGNDPAGTGTQPASGALSTWVDKSGFGKNMTAVGTTPTFSSGSPGYVNFGGAGYYSNATPVFSNVYTAFFVYKQTAGNNGPLYTTADTGGFNGFFGNYNSLGTYLVTSDGGYWSTTTTTPFPFGTTQIATTSYSSNVVGGAVSLYANGSNVVTTTQTGTITYTAFFLGRRNPEILAGTMYEVIGFKSALTTSQRQQVEYYLSRKWGISGPPAVSYGPPVATYGPAQTTYGPPAVSFAGGVTQALPATHPFRLIPPSSTQPPQFQDAASGNWAYDWQPHLTKIIAANAGATASATTITTTSQGHWGGVLAPNGCIYCAPTQNTNVLVIDTATNKTFDIAVATSGYQGGVLGTDGKIYFIPSGTPTSMLVVDPATNNYTPFFTGSASYTGGWVGGTLAPNGKIYCAPLNATNVLVVDPINQTTSNLVGAATYPASGNYSWQSSVLAPNGLIYMPPAGATTVLVVNPITNTTSNMAFTAGSTYQTNGWIGAVLHPNGKIYCAPYSATSVLIIDPVAGTTNTTTLALAATASAGVAAYTTPAGWSGATLGADGKIYCSPHLATSFLVIDPVAGTTSNLAVTNNTTPGAVLAPNGKIYGIPRGSATTTLVVTFSGLSQLPSSNYCMSAYTNKF